MSASEYVWPLVFFGLGVGSALWFGWQLHPFWCRHRTREEEVRLKLFKARLDLLDVQSENRGLRAARSGEGKGR